jgi:hypothetical protein
MRATRSIERLRRHLSTKVLESFLHSKVVFDLLNARCPDLGTARRREKGLIQCSPETDG